MTTERRSMGSEGHAPWTDSEEASVRDLVRWPGPTWSDVNSTVLLDYLAGALATLDAARLAAQPVAGEDARLLANVILGSTDYAPHREAAERVLAALQPASEDPG